MTDQEIVDELTVQAAAAIKLAKVSLEFMMNLAAAHGLSLDLKGAADALVSRNMLNTVDRPTAELEHRSRVIAASILREMDIDYRRG